MPARGRPVTKAQTVSGSRSLAVKIMWHVYIVPWSFPPGWSQPRACRVAPVPYTQRPGGHPLAFAMPTEEQEQNTRRACSGNPICRHCNVLRNFMKAIDTQNPASIVCLYCSAMTTRHSAVMDARHTPCHCDTLNFFQAMGRNSTSFQEASVICQPIVRPACDGR